MKLTVNLTCWILVTLHEALFNLDMDAGEWLNLIRIELNGTMEKTKAWAILRNEMAWYLSTDPLHYLFLFKVFSQWKPFLQSLFYFYVSCMRPMSLQYANFRHFKVWSIKTYLPCSVRAISIVFHWLEVTRYISEQ